MADSPKQRASSLAEEPQQDDALASDDEDGAPAAKPHPPVGGSPKPHPPVTGSPKRPGETPLRARSKTFGMSEEAFPPASGGPEPGRQSAADARFFAPKTRRRDTVYASHVEVENSVEAFWRLCALHPRLIDEAEAAHEESLTAEEKDARAQRRRKRIRAKAEAAMAEFERLPEIERYDPQKQGDLDMYSEENLAIRERLRDDRRVCRMLERRAAKGCEIPNFKGSYLGRFPLVLADFWTSDQLSERSRSVDAFFGTRARGTLTLKRR